MDYVARQPDDLSDFPTEGLPKSMHGMRKMMQGYVSLSKGSFDVPEVISRWLGENRSSVPLLMMLECTRQIAEEQGLEKAFPYASQCAPYLHPKYAAIQVQEVSELEGDPSGVIRQALEALAMQGHVVEGEIDTEANPDDKEAE